MGPRRQCAGLGPGQTLAWQATAVGWQGLAIYGDITWLRRRAIQKALNGRIGIVENMDEETVREDRELTRVIEHEYAFISTIGYGAHSHVYRSLKMDTHEEVAVKMMKRSAAPRAAQEAEIMRAVEHENVVRTLDVIETPTHFYIVQELMRGGDLFDVISERGLLSEQEAAQVLRSVVRGLEYLHGEGIVHRDVKPENILTGNDTFPLIVKVGDFGLAEWAPQGEVTEKGIVGTLDYASPEMLRGEQHGPPVDMWGVGCLLYVMISGRYPFGGHGVAETMTRVQAGDYNFAEEEWGTVSEAAKSLVRGLLQGDAQRRLTAAAALHHPFLAQADEQGTQWIGNDLTELRRTRRKLRRVGLAARAATRMLDAVAPTG